MHMFLRDTYQYSGREILHNEEVTSEEDAALKCKQWLEKNSVSEWHIHMIIADKPSGDFLLVTRNLESRAYEGMTEEQWIDKELERSPTLHAPSYFPKSEHVEAIRNKYYFSRIIL